MKLLSIGSVSPTHGGKTQGGVAIVHSTTTIEFANNPGLDIEIVGIVATNSDFINDPVTLIPYYSKQPGESPAECLQRLIELLHIECILVHHITHSWASALSELNNPPLCVGYVHSLNAIDPSLTLNFQKKRELLDISKPAFDLLIFNSPHSYSRALGMEIEFDCPIKIIPPSVSWDFVNHVNLEELRDEIVFVGRLDENKGIKKLIDAISVSSIDLNLTIVGQGPLQTNIINSMNDGKVKIKYFPDLNSEEIAKTISGALLLCVPSDYESFGLVYVESLCVGTPVIGFGPSIEFIEKELGIKCGVGLIESNMDSITNAIKKIIQEQWDKESISTKAKNKFNPLRHAKELSHSFHQAYCSKYGD